MIPVPPRVRRTPKPPVTMLPNNIDPKSPEAMSLALGLVGGVAILVLFVLLSMALGMSSGLFTTHGIP
jgi:hypothetical protein